MLYNLIFPGQCACCGANLSIYKQSIGCTRCYDILLDEGEEFKNSQNLKKILKDYNFFFLNIGLHKQLLKRAKLTPSVRALKMLFEVSILHSNFDYSKINNCNLIVPIPSHFSSLLKRGFSPAAEFTKTISDLIDVKFSSTILRQKFGVKKQAKLKKEARFKNVQNSFYISSENLEQKSILLVDDIITTGATVEEAKRVLLQNGASRVDILSMSMSPLGFNIPTQK